MVSPHYCETLYKMLNGSTYDFSVCEGCRFNDGESPKPRVAKKSSFVLSNLDYFKAQIQRSTGFAVWNKLYRRSIFEKVRFASGKIHEDVIWSGDLVRNLHNGVTYTDEQNYLYRKQRTGSITQSTKCSPDRIFAGEYLIESAKMVCPELINECLCYAVEYPWMFVDSVYTKRTFAENREFLDTIQSFLKKYLVQYKQIEAFSSIQRYRMGLFSTSQKLYCFNAYARLARVYLYNKMGKDPYIDGHGI